MFQLQHRNKNQNFISNFVLQFMKKTKWYLKYTDYKLILSSVNLHIIQNSSFFQNLTIF